MSIDTEHFRALLDEERARVQSAIKNLSDEHPGSLEDETDELATASDNHMGDLASVTVNREIDYSLGENSEQVLADIDAALKRIDDGSYGTCTNAARRSGKSGWKPCRGPRSASTTLGLRSADERSRRAHQRRGAGAAREIDRDVRVGSSPDALSPELVGERRLGARASHWLALVAIALAAVAADQLTKHIVVSQLQLEAASTSSGRCGSGTCRTPASRSGCSRRRRPW